MNSNQKNQPEKISFFARFVRNVKSLQEYEWVVLSFTFLLGFSIFLVGFIIQRNNPDIGHAIMAFAVVITLESITTTFNHFIANKKIRQSIDETFEVSTKNVLDKVSDVLKNETENLARVIAGRVKGTQHIMDYGIVNILEGLDLELVLNKCRDTTVILQRLYFSPKEFEILQKHLVDLIVNRNCVVKILLLSPSKKDIIEDRAKNCIKYQKILGFAVFNISRIMKMELEQLLEIIKSLPPEKRNNLQVHLHCDYTIAAFTAYHDVIITGLYLNEDTADEGFQEMKRGRHTKSYQIWWRQFIIHWENSFSASVNDLDNDLTGTY